MKERIPKSRAAFGFALVLTGVHLVLAGLWLAQHELPTGGRDEFFIVEVATDIAYRLGEADWEDLRPLIVEHAYYPPLVRVPAVVALLLGGGYKLLVVSGWIWLPFLLAGTWSVGRDMARSAWGGAFAVALLLPCPGLAEGLHHYESNLGAMAMAACCLAVWLRSEHFQDLRMSLLFGLFLGLGMLSDRLGVLPFVILPMVASTWLSPSRRKSGKGLALVLLAVLATAGWWYFGFFGRFAQEIIPQFFSGEINRAGDLLEERPALAWWLLHYVLLWPDSQLGLIGGSVGILGLGWALHKRREGPRAMVLNWILAGLALFTLSQKRQVYYTLPLLPAAAALGGAFLFGMCHRYKRRGTVVVVLLVAAMQVPALLTSSPGLVDIGPSLRSWLLLHQSPLDERVLGGRFPLGGPPVDTGLDMDANFEILRRAGVLEGDRIAVFSTPEVQVTEHYQVILGRIAHGGMGIYGLTVHPEGFLTPEGRPTALLFIHRGSEPWPAADDLVRAHDSHDEWKENFEPLKDELESWKSGAELLIERELADSDRLALWRLAPRTATLPASENAP
ncbi:MAG: hypothetical protein VX498_12405 [Myxococcota bacterium]|nr:hypothetical protein [Myxococcota bacterium]